VLTEVVLYGLPAAAAVVAAMLILMLLKRKKQRRRDLRLASGQSSLLGDQIEERLALLEDYDPALRAEAEHSLDMLQVALIDRQAHLLNFEDLAMLQRYKLEIQETSARDYASQPPTRQRPPQGEEIASPPASRTEIEDQLFEKINQLNSSPKRPRRPRA
jgi:hypothetical protein